MVYTHTIRKTLDLLWKGTVGPRVTFVGVGAIRGLDLEPSDWQTRILVAIEQSMLCGNYEIANNRHFRLRFLGINYWRVLEVWMSWFVEKSKSLPVNQIDGRNNSDFWSMTKWQNRPNFDVAFSLSKKSTFRRWFQWVPKFDQISTGLRHRFFVEIEPINFIKVSEVQHCYSHMVFTSRCIKDRKSNLGIRQF